MQVNTRAIVLHHTKYSETSIITKLFTEQLGVVSYMVNGVRSSKGKHKAVLFQPSTLLEIQATQRENKTLQRLTEYKRLHTYETIPFDIKKTAVTQLLTETLNRTISHHEPNTELFEFAWSSFVFLDTSTTLNPDFHLIFLLQLSAILGFRPHGNYTSVTPMFDLQEGSFVSQALSLEGAVGYPYSHYISELKDLNTTHSEAVIPNGKARSSVLNHLLNYFRFHIADFGNLKSPEVLRAVFE
ncbi:MAG: DNA repair protein RecO [Chitinophagales bacterium]|nr:DNA repair protein RecO [Chitinophagales bacterium]